MGRPTLARGLFALCLAACGGHREPETLGRMVPTGAPVDLSAPDASTASSARAPSSAAPALPPVPLDVKIVTLRTAGSEPRILATSLRAALPEIRVCFEKASPKAARWLDVALSVDAAGVASGVKVKGDLAPEIGACVEKLVNAQRFEPKPGRVAATLEAGIRFSTVDETARPGLSKNDTLFRSSDGSCLALEAFDCPPNKICAAPRERPIACPTEFGLAEIAKPDDAEKRFDLSLFGGKAEQVGERVMLSRLGDRCSLYKLVGIDAEAVVAREELVDIPCADFERAFALSERIFKRAVGTTTLDPRAVTRGISVWGTRKERDAGTRERAWKGKNEADAAFDELARVVAKIASSRGSLKLARFGE